MQQLAAPCTDGPDGDPYEKAGDPYEKAGGPYEKAGDPKGSEAEDPKRK